MNTAATAIQYWFSVASLWSYLGSARFIEIASRHGAQVEVLPVDLGRVFAASGGLPFAERAEQRQSYRQLELAHWSARLGVPLKLSPRFYPVDRQPASCLLIAARNAGVDTLSLSHAILRAIWHEERNIAEWQTLASISRETGFEAGALVEAAKHPMVAEQFRRDTERAIQAQVFGAPTFMIDGERFWGQDRLDFVEQRLRAIGACMSSGPLMS